MELSICQRRRLTAVGEVWEVWDIYLIRAPIFFTCYYRVSADCEYVSQRHESDRWNLQGGSASVDWSELELPHVHSTDIQFTAGISEVLTTERAHTPNYTTVC